MAEPSPQPTPEKFSERPEIKALLEDLKVEVEQQRVVIDEIDRRFAAEKSTALKDARDARLELATRLTAGMETPELVVEVSRIIQEELIEGMMKAGDLKALTLTDLLDLEADQPGILLFAFTTWGEAHKDVELEHFALYTNPAAGTEMTVNFRGNREAYWKVGAGNLLPPQVDVIKVTDAQGNTRIGKRRTSPRNGFYDENGYLSIFDGYKITIATPANYTGPEPTAERKPREVRVDVIDTTGSHTRRARRAARKWRGESGERVRANEPDLRRALPSSWLDAGQDASDYYRETLGISVDPAVTFAIIHAESSFNPGTPNLEGKSTALGLGQFIKGTWDGFVRANESLIQTLTGTDPDHMSPAERLNLRTHPLLSIYAVTWYVAQNARDLGLREVTPDNAADLYFYYHEGPDGGKRYLEYERYRATDSEDEAAERARLHIWQRTSPVKGPNGRALRDERNRIIYQPGTRFADENLAHVRDVARKVERFSRQYHPQLARRERQPEPAPSDRAPDRSDQVAALEPYRTPAQLDRLARNPVLAGHTLLIGSSSTVGYAPKFTGGTIETEAKKNRSIVTMFEELQRMPLERLRSFDRIVLQGGVKNTDHDADTIDTSIRTMDAMVAYVREHAPDVKIYVLEVTPWNAHYDGKIRDFNDHLNSPSFRARVAGVIPTYAIMDNGEGRQRAAFGKPGELHVARYDRYAGVLADWITRHEPTSESPEVLATV